MQSRYLPAICFSFGGLYDGRMALQNDLKCTDCTTRKGRLQPYRSFASSVFTASFCDFEILSIKLCISAAAGLISLIDCFGGAVTKIASTELDEGATNSTSESESASEGLVVLFIGVPLLSLVFASCSADLHFLRCAKRRCADVLTIVHAQSLQNAFFCGKTILLVVM